MSFLKYSNFLLIILFFISCEENRITSDEIIQQQDDITEISLLTSMGGNLSAFIDEIRVVQLDTSLRALVGMPSEVVFENDSLYILDTHRSKGIYSFKTDGDFNYKIARFGKGPGEYTLLQTMSIYDDTLIAWAADKRKLLHFNKQTGEFIHERRLEEPFLISSIRHNSDGSMIVVNDNFNAFERPNSLYLLDSTLKSINTLSDAEEMSSGFIVPAMAMSKSPWNKPLYKHPLRDLIYEVDSTAIIPKYRVLLSESDLLKEEDLLLSDDELFKKIGDESLYLQSYMTLHSFSYISIGLIKGHDINQGLLYSKKTQKTIDYSKIKNDVFEFDLPIPIATYKDYMVFVIEPEEVEHLETVFKKGAEKFAVPNSGKTIRGNLALVLIKFKF